MTLRPTPRALSGAAVRWSLIAIPGLLLIYAGWSSKVVVPAIFGTLMVVLAAVAFVNSAVARLQFDAGVLTARSLLGQAQIRVDRITGVVPITLRYRRTFPLLWYPSAQMYEIRTHDGPARFFLNPNVYGKQAIEGLLCAMWITPEKTVQERFLDVFSMNRDYGGGRPPSSRQ